MENLIATLTKTDLEKVEKLPKSLRLLLEDWFERNQYNIMLMTDSYKASHSLMYPPNTEKVYSYLEARGGKIEQSVFFGLQYYLKKYLTGVRVTAEKINEAQNFWDEHVGPGVFDRQGWEYILNVCGGKLPIKIKAVPEGSVIPIKNVLMTIENTHPRAYFLTNFVETLIMKIWASITIASNSHQIKKLLKKFAKETSDEQNVDFGCHDFGYRGVSSEESAEILSASHMLSFMGTDTIAGIKLLRKYYNTTSMPAYSIRATEHSVMCLYGIDGEESAFKNILQKHPDGKLAIVSDTYNIYNACDYIVGQKFKDLVLARTDTTVIRPDSGDPVLVMCGDPTAELNSLEYKGVLRILAERFGTTINSKGYLVLNPKIRVIQGDGVDYALIEKMLERMKEIGFASENIVFGSGGGLLQKHDRDTMKFALKATYGIVNGEGRMLQKNPVTDNGKRSKKGLLKLVYKPIVGAHGVSNNSYYQTIEMNERTADFSDDILETVFEDGKIVKEHTLEEIRERIAKELD
jgi:nicotinamide phosphoribosyltransferase